MSKLGKRLIKAAREACAIARGEADPATYRVHVPADPITRALKPVAQSAGRDRRPRGAVHDLRDREAAGLVAEIGPHRT